MKIAIIGSRGIPASYGGFETFAEKISEIIADAGHDISVIGEKGNASGLTHKGSVKIIESTYKKSKNPLLFYFNSLKLAKNAFDVVIVCGVGGALFYPFFKFKNQLLITNVDGLEHLRGKYSFIQRMFVRVSQSMVVSRKHKLIADSKAVGDFWLNSRHVPQGSMTVIAYGAERVLAFDEETLIKYGLIRDSYYLVIARLVPENHILEIVEGFLMSNSQKKLVIVGGLQKTNYLKKVREKSNSKIIFTDAIYSKLHCDSLRIGAVAYIHGHSVGGTNPALLEAMSASCVCICHDNIFNREVTATQQLYFTSASELSQRIIDVENMAHGELKKFKESASTRIEQNYTWKIIGDQYLRLLNESNERGNRL